MAVEQTNTLWTKDFILALVTNFFITMVHYLLIVSMALYAGERFEASDSVAGLASSSFIIGSVVARLFAGRLMEVVGRKRMLIVSLAACTILSCLYIPSGSLGLLLTLRLLHGMAFGAGNTTLAAGVQGLIPPARRSAGTGYFGVATTSSTAVGPFLAVVLSAGGNYHGIFWFCTASSICALLVGLLVRLPGASPVLASSPSAPAPSRMGRRRLSLTSFVEKDALPISVVTLLGGFAYSGIVAFLTSYTREQGRDSMAALFFLVYAIAVLVARLVVGRIQDRRGDNIVMYPMLLIFAVGLALLAFQPGVLTIMFAAVCSGLGFGGLMPSVQAMAVKAVPEARIGLAISTFYVLLDVGVGFGPVLLGAFLPLTGFAGMYAALSASVVLTIGVYLLVHGRKPEARRPVGAHVGGAAAGVKL
ncbi:MFS transporter [Pseudarthrobacter sp. fls2-241-R2A-168]|uniref:MFS transporter n=1 Tax=Pseudarthrobacter sp. fls2-241-R2A-168 TaxID=3040304 RepID=UPI0025557316|nr:MFS transporter [Pseudarthrobacter sp. fls2-241-R2A-168]